MGHRDVRDSLGGRAATLSQWPIVALGVALTGVSLAYVWTASADVPLAQGVIGAVSLALALCLVAIGIRVGDEFDGVPSRRIVAFALVGGVAAALLNGWTIGVATLVGDTVPNAPGLLLTNVSLGTFVGTAVGVFRARSRAESATSDRLVRAMDMTGDGVALVDTDGRISYVNDAFAGLHGYPADALVGMPARRLVVEDHRERLREASESVLDSGRWRGEIRGKRRDGSTFPLEVTFTVMDDGTFVVVARDIAERREREERVAILQRVLRHNLRNELNLVSGHATHIERKSGEDVAEHATVIRDVVRRLTALSDTARDVEQALGRTATPVQYRLDRLVAEAVDTVEAEYPDVSIDVDVPPAQVVVDRSIVAAIEELLENAAEHATDGSEGSDVISVTGERDEGETVALRVADEGPGMPAQERGVLTEGHETPLEHGSGLGLWLVRWLVIRAGGSVAVRDNEPHGTVVELRFRRATDGAERDSD